MKYTQRHIELNAQFQLGVDTHLNESNIDIRFIPFNSFTHVENTENVELNHTDDQITENNTFVYPIFVPSGMTRAENAILLLHGLNERNWSKYLSWAEHLCIETGKPIILFPIAFHVNRSPQSWSNPRDLQGLLNWRRQQNGEDRTLSFANVTFSERISENPYRFYKSGRQTLNDLTQLFNQIKQGSHPLFAEKAQIDIFAYSIGAFLAEITLMTNPLGLFSGSKLFLFCGGGIFSAMFGKSRCIMDKTAYERLFNYYLNDFATETKLGVVRDRIFEAFKSMICKERNANERESFFKNLGNKVKGISLTRDKVMPYCGVVEAMGVNFAESRITKLDFPFEYSHENPFPVGKNIDSVDVDASFTKVFAQVVDFFR